MATFYERMVERVKKVKEEKKKKKIIIFSSIGAFLVISAVTYLILKK